MKKSMIPVSLALCVLFTVLCLNGCGGADTQKQAVSNFVTKVLSVPNDEVKKVYLDDQASGGNAPVQVVRDFLGEDASEKLVEDSLNMSSDVMALHFQAIRKNASIAVEKVDSVEKISESQYSYSVTAKLNDESKQEKEITLHGAVQFDGSGKIEYVSVSGGDFDDFMKN